MKKILAIVLAIVLACAFTACQTAAPAASEPAQSAPEEATEPAAEPAAEAAAASDVKVGVIIDVGGLGDQSINDMANDAMKQVAADFGVQTKLMEPTDMSQFVDMNQSLAQAGYNVIIDNCYSAETAVATVADMYPDTWFLIIDTTVDKPNVISANYETHEGSFLAGAVAAMMSKTGIVGFVGGMQIPTIERYEKGYAAGAQYINPDIQVIVKYIGNDSNAFSDAPKGKALAEDLSSNGADVIYHAAGGSGLGVIDCCEEKGIWAIGVDVDQSSVAPETVLTSMMNHGEVAIHDVVEAYINGTEINHDYRLSIANGGVGLADSKHFTDEIRASIADITEKILSGEIVVPDALAE